MATSHTHKVVKGDTLSELAVRYGTTVSNLMKLNPDIKDPDLIYVGQEIIYSGTANEPTTNTTYYATITAFGLQSNTDNVLFATWSWDKSNTEKYQIRWKYQTEDGRWFYGSNSSISVDENDPDASKQSTYTIPSNAEVVTFEVKPISKKKEGSSGETTYWTAGWSTKKTYNVSDSPPKTPGVPNVSITDYVLKAELSNIDANELNAKNVEFQIIKNNTTVLANSGKVSINTNTNYVSYSHNIDAGGEYKVRCRSWNGNKSSEWSDTSSGVAAIPSTPESIITCKATSETSVYLEWSAVNTATSYDIQYATEKDHFDITNKPVDVSTGSNLTKFEVTDLATGAEYFFRVRAVNSAGSSKWSSIVSTPIGSDPAAPTTWSSTMTVISGEPLTLYWVHNSADGSSQTKAELELDIEGVVDIYTIQNLKDSSDKDYVSIHKNGVFVDSYEIDDTQTQYFVVDTSAYTEGAVLKWRVRTAGATKVLGEWDDCIQRIVNIYDVPSIDFSITDSNGITYEDDSAFEVIEAFPLNVTALGGSTMQAPIGYHLSIIANDVYETVDNTGVVRMVNKGEEVYAQHFDITGQLSVAISAGDVDLENNVSYTITCVVSLDSGLTATVSWTFTVAWTDISYPPNAEIGIDKDTYSAYIRPHCEDGRGKPIDDVVLSVYRREFDGGFTELAKDIPNTGNSFITDPHPALDYARYRIVSKSITTGAISYYDVPGYPVGGKAIVIQWDEEWSSFDAADDISEQPAWSGSVLKLPYNIDISDHRSPDVSHVSYIGRKHPVGYHGTQLGETATWNVEIPYNDKETLYSIRRLSVWTGDVYVREPSGSGYWASVVVSFNQKHCVLTIPVTIEVTRVEGGI